MSKLRRGKEQRKADREQKRQTPKVKMRSYGGGEKLPIVKTGDDFFLADQKYDNLGHGEFEGQTTGKLQGPSKRAIKGKGKKSANVRVGHGSNRASDDGDPIFLEDTSPVNMKNDYSSMKSMGQAVARWTSPNKLTGKASPMEEEGLSKSYYTKKSKKEQDKESVEKYGVAGSSKKTKKAKKSIEKDKKKQAKKDYKESEEGKEATAKKRELATDIVNMAGAAIAAAGGTTVNTPSKTASQKGQEQRDKEKKDKDKEKVKDSSQKGLESLELGKKK